MISRRIDNMASDVLCQVVTEVKESSYEKFSLQFDESTDVSSCALLLGFIRYVHFEEIKEEFLLCEHLLTTTKGVDVFNIVNEFLVKNNLDWNNVQQVCKYLKTGYKNRNCLHYWEQNFRYNIKITLLTLISNE